MMYSRFRFAVLFLCVMLLVGAGPAHHMGSVISHSSIGYSPAPVTQPHFAPHINTPSPPLNPYFTQPVGGPGVPARHMSDFPERRMPEFPMHHMEHEHMERGPFGHHELFDHHEHFVAQPSPAPNNSSKHYWGFSGSSYAGYRELGNTPNNWQMYSGPRGSYNGPNFIHRFPDSQSYIEEHDWQENMIARTYPLP